MRLAVLKYVASCHADSSSMTLFVGQRHGAGCSSQYCEFAGLGFLGWNWPNQLDFCQV